MEHETVLTDEALAKLWGQRINAARTRKLSPERRKEIAQKAARARWKKKNGGGDGGGGGSSPAKPIRDGIRREYLLSDPASRTHRKPVRSVSVKPRSPLDAKAA